MTVTRELKYDEKTKLLHVKTLSEEDFKLEQIKEIIKSTQVQLDNAEKQLKRVKDLKLVLNKIQKEPRTKELVEIIFTLMPENIQLPNLDNLGYVEKFYKEQRDKLEKDLNELNPFADKS
jgi:DNA-binding transcriptional MerR regulator